MAKTKKLFILLLMFIVVCSSVIFNGLLKKSIINAYKEQAKLELNHIKTCFNLTTGSIIDRLNKCASASLIGGPTGDAFVVNLKDMQVIWDNSVDCKIGKKSYLTKDSICKIAKDTNSCLLLANKIKTGYDGCSKWNFDGSPEYDVWTILPDEIHNFDGSIRAIDGEKDQIALVQGFQYDEIMKKFTLLTTLNKIVTSIILFILIICYFIICDNCVDKQKEK